MINEKLSFGVNECPIVRSEGIYYGGRRVIRLGLSAVERTNPLPAGRYWVDVFTPQEAAFQSWLQRNKANVIVTSTETFPGETHWFGPDDPGRVWRLFEVNAPVTWEGPGFPTIAGASVKSSADTSDRPAPEPDAIDKLKDLGGDTTSAAKTALIVTGVAVVVVAGVLIAYYAPPRRPEPKPEPTPAPTT
jgi:hypothetical protein